MRLLGLRMHSEAELTRKLRRRGYEAEDIDGVLASCLRLGYLDDARYATALVERRAPSRGASAMAAELRSKGIRRDAVDIALAPVDREVEIENATILFARYAQSATPVTERQLLDKVGPRLQRRGFGPQVVREACRRHLAEQAQTRAASNPLD